MTIINYYTGFRPIIKGLNRDIQCVGCKHQGLHLIRSFKPDWVMMRRTFVMQCPECYLLQAWPMPNSVEITKLYIDQYRQEGTTGFDELEITNRHKSQERFISESLATLGIFPKKIIDIGAGFGQLLSLIRQRFPDAELYATELDAKCISFLSNKGIHVKNISIEECTCNPFDTQFDLILCSHVIEHSASPKNFLNLIHAMLQFGGALFIEVPNCGVPYFWGESDFPHLVFFSSDSLIKIVEKANFSVNDCFSGGPSTLHYISPLLFKTNVIKNIINELKFFLKSKLPYSILIKASRLLKYLRKTLKNKSTKNRRFVAALKMNEVEIDNVYKEFYYKNNPYGIFLRCFAVKKS